MLSTVPSADLYGDCFVLETSKEYSSHNVTESLCGHCYFLFFDYPGWICEKNRGDYKIWTFIYIFTLR